MTTLVNQIGLEALKRSDLLQIIAEDMTSIGFRGNEKENLLIYLTAISRKSSYGLYTCFMESSAVYREELFTRIKHLILPDEALSLEGFSLKSLSYELNMEHNCLLIPELDKKRLLEVLLKDHKLSLLTTEYRNGERKAVNKKYSFTGSAFVNAGKGLDPNLSSLFFIIRQCDIETDRPMFQSEKIKIEEIFKKHYAIQSCLKERAVIFPDSYRDEIAFPYSEVRYRRDHKRFLNLIAAICFLRQYQKEVKYLDEDTPYIEIDDIDYETAYHIFIHTAGQDETFNKKDLEEITLP